MLNENTLLMSILALKRCLLIEPRESIRQNMGKALADLKDEMTWRDVGPPGTAKRPPAIR